jgi:hypothetical protein
MGILLGIGDRVMGLERTNRIRRMVSSLMVTASEILGSSAWMKGWIDPHGNFHAIPGGLTHEHLARKIWDGKTETEDMASPLWGSKQMYKNGWARVVPYGRDTLSAEVSRGVRSLTYSQLEKLKDLAIEEGMTSIRLDNGNSLTAIWEDEDLLVARSKVGFEFPSQDAMSKYLKDHPKAKKENHWVQDQKPKKNLQENAPKTEEKADDSGKAGKFRVPEHKLLKFEMDGDLGNMDNWRARIVLGNSMGEDKKVGDMDKIGYVAFSTVNDEIVPIARADEHQAGYELLYHLDKNGAIRSRPQDFITLFNGSNYPHCTTKDTKAYASAVKKWLACGGPNVCVHSQKNGKNYVTDMEEYAALGGDVPYEQKGPSKAGREILDHLEGAIGSLREGKDKEALEHAKKLANRLEVFRSYVGYPDVFIDELDKMEKDRDISGLGRAIKAVAKDIWDHLKEERDRKYSYVSGLYGTGDDADKRLEKAAGADTEPPKKEGETERPRLSDVGHNIVSHLEKAAKAGIQEFGRGIDRMKDSAMDLIFYLQPMMEDVDDLGPALERLHRAMAGEDSDEIQQALFSYNGVKNLLHQRLRKLMADGVVKDKHFGDVKSAFEEFERLGQI